MANAFLVPAIFPHLCNVFILGAKHNFDNGFSKPKANKVPTGNIEPLLRRCVGM